MSSLPIFAFLVCSGYARSKTREEPHFYSHFITNAVTCIMALQRHISLQ